MVGSAHLTLDTVAQQFADWRAEKKSGERIPQHLWVVVRQLMSHYKPSKIMTRLHLSSKQVQREGLLPTSSSKQIKNPRDRTFVNIDLPASLATPLSSAQPSILFERTDGIKLSLVNPTEAQVNVLINRFLG